MNKRFIVLGDLHIGARNDAGVFHIHFELFFDDLFKYVTENKITDIFQLGDIFDRRKYINFLTLDKSRAYFFDKLAAAGVTLHILVGNHDIHWRDSLEVNSPSLLLSEYSNVKIYTSPTTVEYDGTTIDIIPWMCKENQQECIEYVRASKSDLCFGHFEFASFQMYRGVESQGGYPSSDFIKYEMVCSGHYHTKSRRENIVYVGTPYEITWQDCDDPRGFHVFDVETRNLEFIYNPHTVFIRLEYDDTKDMANLNDVNLANKFVRVVVTHKTDLYKFDQYIQKLYTVGCYEVKIVEDMSEFADGEIGEEIDLEDTMDVLGNYIDSIDTEADKENIKSFMKSLYIEAINLSVYD